MERRIRRKALFNPPQRPERPLVCICDRPKTIVLCRECGRVWDGRKRIDCPAHLKKMGLMDHVHCIAKSCRSLDIVEPETWEKLHELIRFRKTD